MVVFPKLLKRNRSHRIDITGEFYLIAMNQSSKVSTVPILPLKPSLKSLDAESGQTCWQWLVQQPPNFYMSTTLIAGMQNNKNMSSIPLPSSKFHMSASNGKNLICKWGLSLVFVKIRKNIYNNWKELH